MCKDCADKLIKAADDVIREWDNLGPYKDDDYGDVDGEIGRLRSALNDAKSCSHQ